MKFTTSPSLNLYAVFLTIFSLIGLFTVEASPIPELDRRDVFTPPILDPHNGTVWKSGEERIVVWDASNPPAKLTNPTGRIMLRKGDLTTPLILAANFDILQGRIAVKVPLVLEDDDYALVLFGDSGNFSPLFTIKSGIS